MPVLTYNCRSCGSALKFTAKTQDWTCEFCGSVYSKGDLAEQDERNGDVSPAREEAVIQAKDLSGQDVLDEAEFNEQIVNYNCPGCGAEIITDQTTAATFCFYCHNPAIIPQQLSGVNRPSKVIPFTHAKGVVVDRFLQWCKKKPLLPDSFTSTSQVDKLTGIYIPYWLFDCDINGRMNATARNVRSWTAGDTRYTETKTYDVYREIEAGFTGVPADGSEKADDQMMETIEPFDYGQIRPFAMPYLSGFQAEKYDVDSKTVFPRVKKRVTQYSSRLLRDTIKGYSNVSVRGSEITFTGIEVEYALLPAWIMTFHYQGKDYYFIMNGQTGKIAGKLPLCKAKAAKYFFGISAAVYLILLIAGMII